MLKLGSDTAQWVIVPIISVVTLMVMHQALTSRAVLSKFYGSLDNILIVTGYGRN